MKNLKEKIEESVKLSIIDLKCNGRETVSLFDILRNSLEFIDTDKAVNPRQKP